MPRRKYSFFTRRAGKNPRAFFVAVIALVLCLCLEDFVGAPQPEQPPAEFITGRVIRVHDGDTFNMLDSSGREIKVRLFGLDAPELAQAHGPESGRHLRGLIEGREIRVESRGYDQYDRLLGLIARPDGRSLSHDLVAAGMLWVYEGYCDIEQCAWLRKAQKEAETAGRGLWADKNPIAPWKYRRGQR